MTYLVEVTAEYNKEHRRETSGLPSTLYSGAFGDEGDARSALSRYIDDETTISKISNRFRPEYIVACIKYRGDFNEDYVEIYKESIII